MLQVQYSRFVDKNIKNWQVKINKKEDWVGKRSKINGNQFRETRSVFMISGQNFTAVFNQLLIKFHSINIFLPTDKNKEEEKEFERKILKNYFQLRFKLKKI